MKTVWDSLLRLYDNREVREQLAAASKLPTMSDEEVGRHMREIARRNRSKT